MNRASNIFLRGADIAAEHASDIKTEERQLPQARHRFCAEALAAPLHADEQNAAWSAEAEFARGRCECYGAFAQLIFQRAEPAHVIKTFLGVVIFEEAIFADELPLLFKDFAHFLGAQPFLFDQNAGENILRLVQR